MSLDVSKSAQQVCQATRTVDAPTAEADNAASANLELATMHMSGESLLVIIVVGVIAGWLAGQIVQGTGFGLIGDFVIGVIGAFIGSWLLPQLGVRIGVGMVAAIANATIGAILLLILLRAIRGSGRFGGRGWWAR